MSRVDNMATCWRSGTRGTCQCVLEVELSYVKVTSTSHTQITSRSFALKLPPKISSFSEIFLSELKVRRVVRYFSDTFSNVDISYKY